MSDAFEDHRNMALFTKLFVGLVGLMYLGLAIWCSVQPNVTSKKVGFELVGGSGKSEFLTVYGGLEFGIGVIILASLLRGETFIYGLWGVVLVHGSLVLFRTIGFFVYSDIGSFTYRLAAAEWLIFLVSTALLIFTSNRETAG